MNHFFIQWLYIVTGSLLGIYLIKKLPRRSFEVRPEPLLTHWSCFLLLAVVGGGYLRFAGISFGLPLQFHPDEIPKAQVITRMAESGSLNPHYFLHPSLLLYLSLFTNKIFHFFGEAGSFYETTFFAGRFVSAFVGTTSIYLVYRIGRMMLGTVPGVMAAGIFAFLPLHITISRYMKEDALLTFFTLLALLFVLVCRETKQRHYALLAGITVGFAASTKYTGVLAILFLIGLPHTEIPAAVGCCFAGFIIGTPYSILAGKEFVGGVLYEKNHALRGHTESISPWSQWWLYHWTRSIQPGVTKVISALFVVGAAAALVRRRKECIIPALFLLFYCTAEWVPSKPAPQPERYISLCLPFVALGVAYTISLLLELRFYIVAYGVFLCAILFPAMQSLRLFENLSPDTREIAAAWIDEHIPEGSTFVMDFQPYSPQISNEKFIILNDPYLPVGEYIDIRKLRQIGVDYIVLSSLAYDRFFSQPNQSVTERVKYRTLFARLPLVAEFGNPAGRYGFHNPKIRVYKVRL